MMSQMAWKQSVRILWGGRFLSSAGLTGISPFIPYYMEQLNVGTPEEVLLWTGLSVSAPALSYALLTPFWGKIGDRWSRKWMVVRALVGLALSMFLMGIAQTPFQFFCSASAREPLVAYLMRAVRLWEPMPLTKSRVLRSDSWSGHRQQACSLDHC